MFALSLLLSAILLAVIGGAFGRGLYIDEILQVVDEGDHAPDAPAAPHP